MLAAQYGRQRPCPDKACKGKLQWLDTIELGDGPQWDVYRCRACAMDVQTRQQESYTAKRKSSNFLKRESRT